MKKRLAKRFKNAPPIGKCPPAPSRFGIMTYRMDRLIERFKLVQEHLYERQRKAEGKVEAKCNDSSLYLALNQENKNRIADIKELHDRINWYIAQSNLAHG